MNYKVVLLFLSIIFFFQGFADIAQTFSSPFFRINAIAFIVVTGVFLVDLLKQRTDLFKPSSQKQLSIAVIGLLGTLIVYTINQLWFQFSIVPSLLVFVGLYFLLGQMIEASLWKRSGLFILLLIMTLPLLERVQKFWSFPLRQSIATLVTQLLNWIGHPSITQSSVIVTENAAAVVDLPCSGIKSIYIGIVIMLTIFLLQRVSLSLKTMVVGLFYLFLLYLFNVWRVFNLVYIHTILEMPEMGNRIHVTLGIIGFAASIVSLYWLTKRFLTEKKNENEKPLVSITPGPTRLQQVLFVSMLLLTIVIYTTASITPHAEKQEIHLSLETLSVTEASFQESESLYFQSPEIAFSKKFTGQTAHQTPYTVIVVGSSSARVHHDPETCLQSIGHTIVDSQVLSYDQHPVKQLSLNQGMDQVYYWYRSGDEVILDYSERVWEEVQDSKKIWTLIQVGFSDSDRVSEGERNKILSTVDMAVTKLDSSYQQ
ncbi:archaeosortase/exosortase family protein [Candidatus Roizmanbacteria bacterium]|nr:archaeosortase/exosortase family protein [Candidatus Roizmanbacteria bacterium]